MPIRIMHVVNSLGKGGLENGVVNLLNGLDQDRFDHVVCTLRGTGPNAERLSKRVRVLPIDCSGMSARLQTPALLRAIRAERPDVVHSRNWSAIEAVFAARLAGSPRVVHSEHGFEADASAPEPWRKTFLRRSAFELAHQVLSVSWQLRDAHAGRTGFSAKRIGVIHNGVDCARFSADPAARVRVRAELGLEADAFCVGCVANLLPVKDHLTFLQAVDLLTSDAHPWRLILVGEGPERETLERFVSDRGWQSRVRFMGSSNRVPELLQAMDAFVLPSIAEGICNSLLEAMASGVAVVATSVGGNPEIIVDGESGLLFAARDVRGLASHLTELRARPDWRLKLAAGGCRAHPAVQRVVRLNHRIERELLLDPLDAAAVLSPGYH
jgi:sugar transferase (PEP-CTERM/EpsH1 system associated)